MDVMVLGGSGMLGHKVFQTLTRRLPEVACTIRGSRHDPFYSNIELFNTGEVFEQVDAMDLASLRKLLEQRKPQVVVNCIGIIKQRAEAKVHIPSITINSLLPHVLAQTCQRWGGRLIHFSTDCVFSGRRGSYTEEDLSDAEDLYGKTKFLGEVATENAVTLRTSIIGRELSHFKSLLEWFLRENHGTVNGFTRAYYSGVTTNHLAEVVADIIDKHTDLSGLYQVASDTISKYDLLILIREAYGLDIKILPNEDYFCDRSLRGDKLRGATGYTCPPWQELVAQLANDPTPHEQWR